MDENLGGNDFKNLNSGKNEVEKKDLFMNPPKIDISSDEIGSKNKEKKFKSFVVVNKSVRNFFVGFTILLVISLAFAMFFLVKNSGLGSFKGLGIPWVDDSSQKDDLPADAPKIMIESTPQNTGEYTAESIYEKVADSVVGVVVYDSAADIISSPLSQGSGVIISDRYIVTNSHVVHNSKKINIKIVFKDETECSGKVVGFDTRTDLAVVKVDKTGLKPAEFGDSDKVKIGSWTLALGNPIHMNFASTLTRGIVSSVNRTIGNAQSLVKFIQTDAAINPGSSGGALFNMYGQVIGITSVKIVPEVAEGMGFAIPSNTVKTVVDDIIAKGYVSGRARLGIAGKMVTYYQSQRYDVPVGMLISEVTDDSDLKNNGVQVGDIITKINDTAVTGIETLYGELAKHNVGDTVKLEIFHTTSDRKNSKTFTVNVKLLEDKGNN